MKACILAVGSEMLTPFRVDTNSLFITERLNAIGYDVRLKAVVGDDVGELARVLEGALAWADLIVITGGLGPTEDDITRDAVARVLGVAARRRRGDRRAHPRALRAARHDDAGDQPAAGDGAARRRRARRIRTARRPGCGSRRGTTALVLLPGPPREMKPMLEAVIARAARAEVAAARGLFRRVLKITGRAESDVDAQAQPVYAHVDDADRADQHDDPRGPRPDRTAPDGAGGEPGGRRRRARRGGAASCRTVLGPSVYSADGRVARSGRRRSAARAPDDDRRRPSRAPAGCWRRG